MYTYHAAKLLVHQHGAGAAGHAAGRVEQLLGEGDSEGAAIWRSIQVAIEELQRLRQDASA
jgi:hypothetical protein